MKKVFRLILLMQGFLATLSIAQTSDHQIRIGTIERLSSAVLKEERTVWVYVPDSHDPKQRYPVLYLLDGEEHFHATVGMVKQMAGVWPELIVVGILNTNRNRDLTPTHVLPNRMTDRDFANASGGGENFMQFIEKELIPHIDSHFPTAPYRVISGHSLGGLTVVNAFVHHTNLFQAYITIDPSLWWDQQQFLRQVESEIATRKFDHKALFVAMASPLLPPGLDTITALKDSSNYTALFRSVTHFVQTLKQHPSNGLCWKSKFYPEERHGTVELNAQYDALKFLFSYYQFRTSQFEFHPELDLDSVLVAHFKNVSDQMGYTVLPSEQLVNNLGYACMGKQLPKKAYAFFKRNTDNYPQSANAFDSLGDYYVWQGETMKAIAAFTVSLRLNETADTRRKLEALTKTK